ncbi:MAG: rod-binding protein [Bdellovibrionales bacterium]|nr:rod-binding protein [Bdellovibrionales bacterium]
MEKIGKRLAPLPLPIDNNRDTRDPNVLKAAKMYEEQFLREMVRAMRSSVPDGGLVKKSMGENIFQGQLDDQYVESWTDRGGVGLGDLIYEHIMERFYSSQPQLRKQGPMPVDPQTHLKIRAEDQNSTTIQVNQAGGAVKCPWDGEVESVQDGVITVSHSPILKSQFAFKNGESLVQAGQKVTKGQSLSLLGREETHYTWKVVGKNENPSHSSSKSKEEIVR